MARKDRNGSRTPRSQRKPFKTPQLGYYLIVTDTEATERCFFTGLYNSLPENVKQKLVIKVIETKTHSMIDKCVEMVSRDAQYRMPWIVFDRDLVKNFDDIIAKAEEKGINAGWSNPCFEIWLLAYFGSMPVIEESWKCCSEFDRVYTFKTGKKYSKSNEHIYSDVCQVGDEEKAIEIAQMKFEQHIQNGKRRPSVMCPCTTVYRLINEIKTKCKCE